MKVGRARGRFSLPATATTGDENFDRFFRAHQNTTEQAVVFLPALYACGYYANGTLAAVIGLVFVMRRMVDFRGYTDPGKKREWALSWVCSPKCYCFEFPLPNSHGAGNVGSGAANV